MGASVVDDEEEELSLLHSAGIPNNQRQRDPREAQRVMEVS